MSKVPERKFFMSKAHQLAMGNLPRNFSNMMEKTGCFRKGKTARDRALRLAR